MNNKINDFFCVIGMIVVLVIFGGLLILGWIYLNYLIEGYKLVKLGG